MKMRTKRKSKVLGNTKTIIVTMTTLFFLTVTGFYLFNWYINIDIKEPIKKESYSAERTSQTVADVKEENKKVSEIIENVSKCVVGISKLKENGNSIFLKDGATKLGLGTGIIVSQNGYILTNEHVSGKKYGTCYVTLENGKNYTANVLWSDQDLDLSIIKIDALGLSYVNLGDSDKIKVGEKVYAIGNPLGFEFQRTVTSGIISAKDRTIKLEEDDNSVYMEDLIQTDATINPGNSGGPLIDIEGNVIGVNSVKITTAEGIGFASPINIIKPILNSYIEEGKFEEASLGIYAYDKEVIPYLDNKLEIDNGIYVIDTIKNGAADKVGIKAKDVIAKIDNISLNKMTDLRTYIYTKKPGDEVILQVIRKGITAPVKIELGKK
ncbi:MAG: trypsin-like serine protease [Bacilli bacterium]|nr:trypsin-like serine protease [Bacilli bacterium]